MTDAYARQRRDEAADLLWALLFTQPADNGCDHARQALRQFPSSTATVIADGLGLLGSLPPEGRCGAVYS